MNIPDKNTNNDINRHTQRCVVILDRSLFVELSRDRFKILKKLNINNFKIKQIIDKSDKIIVNIFKISE